MPKINERGFTLVSALVGVGLVSVVLMGVLSAARQAFDQYSQVVEREAVEEIRNLIRQRVFCPETVAQRPAAGCATNPEVTVYAGDETNNFVLIDTSPNYFQFGQYEIRARCEDGAQYFLKIDYRRVGAASWEEDIFGDLPYGCELP